MGAGAVGSYIGHKLAQIRINATLIARGSHLESMQKNGLYLETNDGVKLVPVKATDSIKSIENSDLIIYTVKTYHNDSVAKQIAEHINPYAKVLCLQNGITSWKDLETIIGKNTIIPGLIYIETQIKKIEKICQLSPRSSLCSFFISCRLVHTTSLALLNINYILSYLFKPSPE